MMDDLFNTACAMVRKGSNKELVTGIGIDGRITTSFTTQSMGSISGIEFFAEVDTYFGRGKVKFLVREADLEAELRETMEWSIQSLHDLTGSHRSRNSAQYN
jgi:hypothetical protein